VLKDLYQFLFQNVKDKKKSKGVFQKLCCKHKKVCTGKRCKVLKAKKCKWTGFETHIYRKHKCVYRSAKKSKRVHKEKKNKKHLKKKIQKIQTKKMLKKERKVRKLRKLRRFASKKIIKKNP